MDYIESELLRQRAVLARLLLGVPAEAGAEEVPSSRRQTPPLQEGGVSGGASFPGGAGGAADYQGASLPGGAGGAAASQGASFPGGAAPMDGEPPWGVPGGGTLQAMAGQQTAELRLMSMPPAGAGQANASRGRAVAGGGQAASAAPSGYGFGGGDVPGTRDSVVTVLPGGDTPAGEQASARTVSLWAERDARRYDGGFFL